MNLKKLYLLGYGVLALISLAVVGVLVYRAYSFDQRLKTSNDQLVEEVKNVTVNLRIDYGEGKVASFSAVPVTAPATVLKLVESPEVAKTASIVTEQKPLGTIIKSINNQMAENGNFWLVYVNEALVTDGLETKNLNAGDNVVISYNKL